MRDSEDIQKDLARTIHHHNGDTADQEERDRLALEVLLDIRNVLIRAHDITKDDGSRIK